MFEVRKPSRSGSKETGETDLGRVLPMNLQVYSQPCTRRRMSTRLRDENIYVNS